MKNTFGNSVTVTLFGESHGAEIGAVLDGLTPGIAVDTEYISHRLSVRRPDGEFSTERREQDEFRIVSGVFNGRTTGTPICILIPNRDVRDSDYDENRFSARPGHADYAAYMKYHGFEDYRGGGHFSGRLTAALTAAGAIVQNALEKTGVLIGTHILRCADISDREFINHADDIRAIQNKKFPLLDTEKEAPMKQAILDAKESGDSVGGILETAVIGIPAGVGEPWFDSAESVLSHMLFSIPAVKGVEFGDGFALSSMRGSQANDEFKIRDGKIVTATNHNGGINGGITNGMPIVFRCAIKPTPSIAKPQATVDFMRKTECEIKTHGRHDPAIFPRAGVVAESVTALALCDMLAMRFGTDFLRV